MVFVDQAAAPGGDGSAERPFQTLRQALELSRPIEAIAVAAGRYPAPASWIFGAALTILPSTAAAPTIEAEAPATALSWTVGAKLVLRDLELASPLGLEGGEIELSQLSFAPVSGPALTLTGAESRIFGLEISSVVAPADQPTSGDGLVVEGGILRWTGGTVVQIPDRAVVLNGVDAELDSLTLASTSRAPLTVGAASEVTARNLQIADVRIGVFVEAARLRLEQAVVTRASTAGLLAAAESSTEIVGSTFTDCANGHISVQGDNAAMTVEGSTLSGATLGPCLFASSTNGAIVIRDNIVRSCAGTGISLFVLSDALAENNEVSNIGPDPMFAELADGISVQNGSARLFGNRVYDTLAYGFALYSAHVLADGNEVGPTGGAGFSIVDPGSAPSTISNNTITQATGVGVSVIGAQAQVLTNVITGTVYAPADGLGDGVAFSWGAAVTVQGNTLSSNDRNGVVFLDGAQGTVAGNQATDNGGYGILEFCVGAANAVVVGDNVLDGNGLGPQSLCSP
jgi:parallel beta-helix repeat protein